MDWGLDGDDGLGDAGPPAQFLLALWVGRTSKSGEMEVKSAVKLAVKLR